MATPRTRTRVSAGIGEAPELKKSKTSRSKKVSVAPVEIPPRAISRPAVSVAPSRSVGTVLIANQHTGGISFPRKGENGIALAPLRLLPGTVTEVDREEWKKRKVMPVVQHYLDRGLLAEVRRKGSVPVLDSTSTELEIPEHLSTEEQTGTTAPSGAKVRSAISGEVTIR